MSSKLIINGGQALHGTVKIGGSKNAALPCIAAALLTDEAVTLKNVPLITDIEIMRTILAELDVKTRFDSSKGILQVNCHNPKATIPSDLSSKIRGGTILLGSLLARCGEVKIGTYGGCPIGRRPIDFHLKAFKMLGARISSDSGLLTISAHNLEGAIIHLPYPSVGATENSIMAASAAKGTTVISNIAVEPEVLDLVSMLRSMGMHYEIDVPNRTITIHGGSDLRSTIHSIIPDRIEVGTYAVAALMTGGDLRIRPVKASHIHQMMDKLRGMGGTLELENEDCLRVMPLKRELTPVNMVTEPYPGFSTDLQPQYIALSTQACGTTTVVESIYENRFHHIPELRRMGARIKLDGRNAVVKGRTGLTGMEVEAKDLRGGAALILAGLQADGTTVVGRFEHITRGYERIQAKLQGVGARIEVVENGE